MIRGTGVERSQPHPVSWVVWSLIGVLGIGASLEGGAGVGAVVPIVFLVIQVCIAALSLTRRFGKWDGVRRSDVALAAVSVVAILVWRFASLPAAVAAAIAITADVTVSWATIREAWHRLWSESTRPWSISALGATLGAAAVEGGSFAALAYPIYLALMISTVAAVLIVRRPRRSG